MIHGEQEIKFNDFWIVNEIPFTEIAIKQAGKKLVANMVALGAVVHLTRVISLKALESTLMAKVPKGTEQMNLKAFRSGIRAAKKFDLEQFTCCQEI
ncbi:MAG: 2-oxoacid:acceptor oxidoreductase family protein [Deltaproteobacteria bacterium]|nr:2-oxoacid:acceptor oxidoreductase family protein [Deltaproteobacteria bacterium]